MIPDLRRTIEHYRAPIALRVFDHARRPLQQEHSRPS